MQLQEKISLLLVFLREMNYFHSSKTKSKGVGTSGKKFLYLFIEKYF